MDTAPADARPKTALALAAAMQGVGGGLGWSLAAALMPDAAKDLGLDKTTSGIAWGAASLGIALAAPLGGAAVDRFGPARVAGAAMFAGAVACAARAFCHGPWTFIATMLVFGAHIGFVAPSIPKALAMHLPATKVARANGFALFAYTIVTALAMLVGRLYVAPALHGWRNVTLVAAALMVVVGVLWIPGIGRARSATAGHGSVLDSLKLLAHGELRKVALMHFCLFGGYLALLGVLPHALLDANVPKTRVGLAIAAWLLVAGFANLAGPFLAERFKMKRAVLVVGGLVAGVALTGLALGLGAWTLPIAALGGGCVAPLLLTAPLEMEGIGPARAGAALGLLMLVGQAGGALLPALSGAIAQRAGFPWALGMLAVAHLLLVVPALALKGTGAPRASIMPLRRLLTAVPPGVFLLAGVTALVALAGCSASGGFATCRVGTDCGSGVCGSNGQCVEPDDAGNTVPDAAPTSTTDASFPMTDAGPVPGCVPNSDGTITAGEVPLKAGLKATFKVATNVTVDVAGKTQNDGTRTWDFSGALNGDHDRLVTTDAPNGSWWAPGFGGATYATRLSESADLKGVFEVSGSALLLRGVVSPTDGLTKTNLTYNPSVPAIQFPLKSGTAWNVNANVTGQAQGVYSIYTEQYASQVDARGSLKTPFGTFSVLRVRTVLTRTVGALITVTRSFAFVAECFGTVATVTSQPNELQTEFTNASEITRLTP
jgi:MFS family permease